MKLLAQESKKVASRIEIVIDISFKTLNAQNYVLGNIKGVLGLFKFARLLVQIQQAAREDNPYADWFLIRIHVAIKQARSKLQRLEKHYQELSANKNDNQRAIILIQNPEIIKAQFASAYSYMAADMLGDYDRVLAFILTAKMTGITLDKKYSEIEKELNDQVKLVLNLPKQWKAVQVTRKDIEQNTEKAKEAFALMGNLPNKILKAEVRAQYAPRIRSKGFSVNA